MATTLSKKEIAFIDAIWRAANYVSIAQIYQFDNPLLRVHAPPSLHSKMASYRSLRSSAWPLAT